MSTTAPAFSHITLGTNDRDPDGNKLQAVCYADE